MKNPTRFYGILMLILGFLLCVVSAFVPGVIFILVGLGMAAAGQPKEAKNTKPVRPHVHRPVAPPVTVPGAPAADAYAFNGTVENYFAGILSGCFPAYNVQRDVSVSALTNAAPAVSSWECSCGSVNTGKFCSECGKTRPEPKEWTCKCGHLATGKFCSECGAVRPAVITVPTPAYVPVGDHVNITFLLRSGTQNQLAILICDKNRWNNVATRNTIEACKQAGIPCLRFIRQFRHRSDYAVERISAALR